MKPAFFTCLLLGIWCCSSVAQDAASSLADKQIKIHVFGGGVNREGAYLIQPDAGILDAIKSAGGFKAFASGVWLCRGVVNGRLRRLHHYRVSAVLDGTVKEALMDGDYVEVQKYVYMREW